MEPDGKGNGLAAASSPQQQHQHPFLPPPAAPLGARSGGGGGSAATAAATATAFPPFAPSKTTSAVSSSSSSSAPVALSVAAPGRAPYVPPRKVFRVDAKGQATYVLADRHTLAMQLGLPYRDLRVIDPMTPSASAESATVFIRERAIGFAIEGVRAVVCADQVLVLGVPPQNPATHSPSASGPGLISSSPSSSSSTSTSTSTLTSATTTAKTSPWASSVTPPLASAPALAPNAPPLPSAPFLRDLVARLTEKSTDANNATTSSTSINSTNTNTNTNTNNSSSTDQQQQPSSDGNLPYELRATEAVLAAAARRLEGDAAALEEATFPALERLASGGSVSRGELERVRESKAALSRLLGRASGVKRAIENILGDPQDMSNMYLGRRAAAAAAAAAQAAAAAAAAQAQEEEAGSEDSGESALEPLAEEEEAVAAAAAAAAVAAVAPPPPSSSSPPTFAVVASSSASAPAPSSSSSPAPPLERALSLRREDSRAPFASAASSSSSSSPSTPTSRRSHGGGGGGGGGGEGNSSNGNSTTPLHAPLLLERTRTSLNGGGSGLLATTSRSRRTTTRNSEGGAASVLSGRGGGGNRIGGESIRSSSSGSSDDNELAAAAEDDEDDDDVRTIAWARVPGPNQQGDARNQPDVEGCEDLMDAYAAIVSSTLRRLEALRERAAATEALVRLDLDRRRNELVAFNMTLSMGGLAIALVSAVGSVFGQNLYFSSRETSLAAWHAATWGSTGAAAILLGALLIYAQRKQLLFIPSTGGMGDEEDE